MDVDFSAFLQTVATLPVLVGLTTFVLVSLIVVRARLIGLEGTTTRLARYRSVDIRQALASTSEGTAEDSLGSPFWGRCPVPMTAADPTERRGALRRRGDGPKTVWIADEGGRPHDGWIHDRSTTGLCLLTSRVVTPGSILQVMSPIAPDGTPWVEVEVKHCRPCDDGYVLGTRFVLPLPWSILLLFG